MLAFKKNLLKKCVNFLGYQRLVWTYLSLRQNFGQCSGEGIYHCCKQASLGMHVIDVSFWYLNKIIDHRTVNFLIVYIHNSYQSLLNFIRTKKRQLSYCTNFVLLPLWKYNLPHDNRDNVLACHSNERIEYFSPEKIMNKFFRQSMSSTIANIKLLISNHYQKFKHFQSNFHDCIFI